MRPDRRVLSLASIAAHTERLVLRPLRLSDEASFVYADRASREAWAPWTPAGTASLSSEDRFARELERSVRGAAAGTHLRLGAFLDSGRTNQTMSDRSDDTFVGLFALNDIVRGVFQSAHASWQLSVDRLGEGYGTEGVRGLLKLAFAAAGEGVALHRVQANIMPANTPSLRLAARVGFRREGVAERYLKIADRWEDHVMFAITVEEWASESIEG